MLPEDILRNLEQDYYNNQTPLESAGKNVIAAGPGFEYIELNIAGKNLLCVLTPVQVSNGPGKKFTVSKT